MERAANKLAAIFVFCCIATAFTAHIARADRPRQVLFRVLHVEDTAVYINVGRNFGLREGTQLALYRSQSNADSPGSPPSAVGQPIAELKVLIVADSSAVCEISNSVEEVRIGDTGFVTPTEQSKPSDDDVAVQAEDHPIAMSFSNEDPRVDDVRPATEGPGPTPGPGHTGLRIGLDYDSTKVAGGFHASEVGFQISSDMTKIGGTNWSFTGYWRGRLRQTFSGYDGSQLESLSNRIDRTYHVGLYYESQTSPIFAGFGRLSVPGAPSLPTIDGGYFGTRISEHLKLGAFGGSTPDPSSWDYNPSQHIAGTFVNYEAGDFGRLHLSSTDGIAMTAVHWLVARQFVFFENTVSWKQYLWFYNSTQVDAARTSPVPGAGSNNTGISLTSSSVHVQPVQRLSVGINHSYSNSLPTFDANLLGTSLLDKYIFQGLSFDVRYELPHHIGLFTQFGRAKSIADAKNMWNKMFGVSFGEIMRTGIHADVRYSQFDSTFGKGNYRSISFARNLKQNFQLQFLGGSQSLASPFTSNTSSRFITASAMWTLGPRYFFETGYTWSKGTTMNYQQWNTMFGYRFGSFRSQ
jgi:hypothetical protein